MNKLVAVIIPVYKRELSENEMISLEQAFHILGKYDIYFMMPESLTVTMQYSAKIAYFKDEYFTSAKAYSRLMLDVSFYQHFLMYDYILIYQLDAFVFENRIEYFCRLGYDYIGAPWLSGLIHYVDKDNFIYYVGNGGFSLRNVKSCINLLCSKTRKEMWSNLNEDIFFAANNGEKFKVAPVEIALMFSFEREVEKCYLKNKKKIPFGCHAWERYNLAFWKPYIESFGYKIGSNSLSSGNEDSLNQDKYEQQILYSHFLKSKKKGKIFGDVLSNIFQCKCRDYYIWGAGARGWELQDLFREAGIGVKNIIDNNASLQNQQIGEYDVISFGTYQSQKKPGNVVIAISKNYEGVVKQLVEAGYRSRVDFVLYEDLIRALINGMKNEHEIRNS